MALICHGSCERVIRLMSGSACYGHTRHMTEINAPEPTSNIGGHTHPWFINKEGWYMAAANLAGAYWARNVAAEDARYLGMWLSWESLAGQDRMFAGMGIQATSGVYPLRFTYGGSTTNDPLKIFNNAWTLKTSGSSFPWAAGVYPKLIEIEFNSARTQVRVIRNEDNTETILPNADKSNPGSWTTTPLWSKITVYDGTVIQPGGTGSANYFEVDLAAMVAATVKQTWQFEVKVTPPLAGGAGNLTVSLHLSDGTKLCEDTIANTTAATTQKWHRVLTKADVGGLVLRIWADNMGARIDKAEVIIHYLTENVDINWYTHGETIPGGSVLHPVIRDQTVGKGGSSEAFFEDALPIDFSGSTFNQRGTMFPMTIAARPTSDDGTYNAWTRNPAGPNKYDAMDENYLDTEAGRTYDEVNTNSTSVYQLFGVSFEEHIDGQPINALIVQGQSFVSAAGCIGYMAALQGGTLYDGPALLQSTATLIQAPMWILEKALDGSDWTWDKIKAIKWGVKSKSSGTPAGKANFLDVLVLYGGVGWDAAAVARRKEPYAQVI